MQFFHSIILLHDMWLFNNAMHQKEIHLMLNDNSASTITHYESHIINI